MITARGLTKHYGRTVAVRDLSFTVRPGVVTGFLGPNGAGKSTTMRMLIGLDRPDAGQALVNGQPYRELRRPLREVGAMLEAKSFHPGRSARAHLRALAASNDIPDRRVEEVLGLVGLEAVGGRRAGKFSLGMAQRLGIAVALLGDPAIVILDEPVNGLDPEGIRWVREAAEVPGRRRPHGTHLQPPDQRGRADRGRAARHRPGAAARPHHGRRVVGDGEFAGGRVLPAHRIGQRIHREERMTTAGPQT